MVDFARGAKVALPDAVMLISMYTVTGGLGHWLHLLKRTCRADFGGFDGVWWV